MEATQVPKREFSEQEKARLLAKAMSNGGESAVRVMAQLVGAAPCPKCQYVSMHCQCE